MISDVSNCVWEVKLDHHPGTFQNKTRVISATGIIISHAVPKPKCRTDIFFPTSEGNSHMLQNNLFLQGGGGENRSLWQKAYSYFADKTNEFEQTRIQHSPWFDLHGWEVAKNYDQSLLMCILAYINYYTQRDDTQWNNVCQYCIFPTLNVVPVQLRFVCVCVCV